MLKRSLIVLLVITGVISYQLLSVDKPLCQDCNVIVVGLDTVGAKHISAFGYDKPTTPTFDSVVKQGVGFSSTIAPASWTVPSFMSLFTGMYPSEHKVVNKYTTFSSTEKTITNLDKVAPGTVTMADEFKKHGYNTGGFTGDSGVGGQFGYKNGFDVYYDQTAFGSIGDSSTKAIDWLKQNPNKKFFMFLHGYDAHGQFKTPADYGKSGSLAAKDYSGPYTGTPADEAALREKQLIAPLDYTKEDAAFWNGVYDSKIKDEDARFASFWNELDTLNLKKKTIVVVVSDHGEEWFEHGGVDHGHTLYSELVHVPLAIYVPGLKNHTQVNQMVSTIDVAPTIFDLLGIKPSDNYKKQFRGTSLLPLLQGKSMNSHDVFLETDYRDFTHKRGIQTTDGWKYIITENTGVEELYNTSTDAAEKTNVATANPEKLSDLRTKVREHLIAMGDNPDKQWTVGCLPVYPTECQ
jgi:arylsulfatase A-like enzyme